MQLFRLPVVAPDSAVPWRFSSRTYGNWVLRVQRAAWCIALATVAGLIALSQAVAAERPVKLVAFGDSLMAGYGLPVSDAFPAKLEKALRAKGLNVEVGNAGVSGDTASDGLARADWSVPDGTDAVVLELGANDALRGIEPRITRAALDKLIRRLKERGISVLLCGMAAPRNMGPAYVREFDAIFPDLAREHEIPLYPFFLDGVATVRNLNQRDGIHPTAAGIDVIVAGILPEVERLVAKIRAQRPG